MKTITLSVLYTTLASLVAGQNMSSSADTTVASSSDMSPLPTASMCNITLITMGINQLTNMKLLSSCSGGTPISVSNTSDANKLPAESLQKICVAPICMNPFREMASSALYKNCVVMYDGKMQNLAERAEHFLNMCKEGGYDDSASGSSDGSGEAGSKKDGTEPVVKDEKSNAAFKSFSAACIAALWFVVALQ